jgi:hypothetical protein
MAVALISWKKARESARPYPVVPCFSVLPGMNHWRDLPATQAGLRVPQDSQVARRGRGIHHQVQRFTVAERPAALCEP